MIELAYLASATLRISVPYAAGGLGGTITERSGTVNIAIEGFMLVGAFAFAAGAFYCQEEWLPVWSAKAPSLPLLAGLLIAILSAMGLSLFHAVTTIIFRADQIVSGLATNFLALGLTDFLLQRLFNSASNSPRVPVFSTWTPLPDGYWWSAFNGIFHPLVILLLLMLALSHFMLNHSRFGLRLRATGESADAALAAGIRPAAYRLRGILIGAAVASVGGVWLVSEQGLYSSNMTAGRGYIALAAVILGKWKPIGVAAVCLLFGFAEALQNRLQVARQSADYEVAATTAQQWLAAVPVQLIQALPYLLTIIVVAGFLGKSTPPGALGKPLPRV